MTKNAHQDRDGAALPGGFPALLARAPKAVVKLDDRREDEEQPHARLGVHAHHQRGEDREPAEDEQNGGEQAAFASRLGRHRLFYRDHRRILPVQHKSRIRYRRSNCPASTCDGQDGRDATHRARDHRAMRMEAGLSGACDLHIRTRME